jgi:hypothetical protein
MRSPLHHPGFGNSFNNLNLYNTLQGRSWLKKKCSPNPLGGGVVFAGGGPPPPWERVGVRVYCPEKI